MYNLVNELPHDAISSLIRDSINSLNIVFFLQLINILSMKRIK